VETRDLDDTILSICSITIEHASTLAGIPQFSYEQVAA
jgi:hypothetical protein